MKTVVLRLLYVLTICVAYSQNICAQNPIFGFSPVYFQTKDTVFYVLVYETCGHTDSIVYEDKMARLTKTKWIGQQDPEEGFYFVMKFKKISPSAWFKENNGILFQADYELVPYLTLRFQPDGTVRKRRYIGTFVFARIIKPKKKE